MWHPVDFLPERELSPTVALITGSEKLNAHPNNVLIVSKTRMVSLLQARRLHLPQTTEATILAR